MEPTDDERALVRQMAAVGIPQEQIALCIRNGITADTLFKHFKDELRESKIRANAKIAGNLYNKAMNGDTAAMIFWLKTQARWSEKHEVEVSGAINVVERVIVRPKDTNG